MTARRRRPLVGPLLVVLAIAAIPAFALFAVYRWADDRADASDAAEPVPATAPVAAGVTVGEPLNTGLFTVRRVPAALARASSVDAFAADLAPVLASLNDRSCAAVSVDGLPVAAVNADAALIPASAHKILIAAVALEVLGPDFVYETSAAAAASPVDGTVTGDLYLVGGGDPLLTSDWYPTSNLERYPVFFETRLEQLADDLVGAGVSSVQGGVIGDGSRYDDEWYAPGWGDGVAGLDAGPYDALLVNDARVLGDAQRNADPNLAGAREFQRLLEERGIAVGGEPGTGTAPADAVELASIQSVPLSELVAEMLLNSDNNTAELVLKEIGLATSGEGGRTAGADAVIATLADWGVATEGLVVAEGSGLAPGNQLTCSALLTVLARTDLGSVLPVAAESGTLVDVFVDHPLAGLLTGKTGTLNNPPFNIDPPAVKALAGYVPVDGGGSIEYVLILNGPTISDQSEYRPTWNALADALATYPAGPTPADLGPR